MLLIRKHLNVQRLSAELHSGPVMVCCRILCVLLLLLVHSCGGVFGAEESSFIIGGHDAPKDRWPWMVHLNISNDEDRWRCGGSILSSEWLLTAASCWNRSPQPKLGKSMAWIGAHDLKKGADRYMGFNFFMTHPSYRASGGSYVNDLGMVKLKKTIRFSKSVDVVALPSAGSTFDSSSECWITGWGNIRSGVPLGDPETLQQVKVSIIPQSVCKQKYPQLTPDQLCAGDLAGGRDACDGDYGGPLVCRTASGFVQVGIMSYGSCGRPGFPTVYTRVSSYTDYINDYIHNG